MLVEMKAVLRRPAGHRRRHRGRARFEIAARAAHRVRPDDGAGVAPGDVLAEMRLVDGLVVDAGVGGDDVHVAQVAGSARAPWRPRRASWPRRSHVREIEAARVRRRRDLRSARRRCASRARCASPPSPITSMSPIMCTLVTGTKRLAPQKRPTSIWYSSARRGASPRAPARIDRSSAVSSKAYSPLPGSGEKCFANLSGHLFPGVGVRRRRALAGDVRPLDREIGIHLEPLLRLAVGVRQDGFRRAFRLAHAAVDALVGMDDEHVVALVEAIHGADLDAVHVLALDAVFGDDVSHRGRIIKRRPAS